MADQMGENPTISIGSFYTLSTSQDLHRELGCGGTTQQHFLQTAGKSTDQIRGLLSATAKGPTSLSAYRTFIHNKAAAVDQIIAAKAEVDAAELTQCSPIRLHLYGIKTAIVLGYIIGERPALAQVEMMRIEKSFKHLIN